MINEENDSTIWYCNIRKSKANEVQRKGLHCFSEPAMVNVTWRVPWAVTVWTRPVTAEDPDEESVIFEVDLQDITEEDTAWVFQKKALRIFKDIPPHCVRVYKKGGSV